MGINKYNCEGYYDPTPYEALTRIENEARKLHSFRPVVYICSPLSGDVEGNQEKAARYCRFAVDTGYIPIAPHLYFPRFMNDANPRERDLALFMDIVLLTKCAQLWVFGGNHLQRYGHRDREGQTQRPDHPLLYRELPGGVRMKIAVGNSRMDKKWKNRDISWEDLCQRVSSTIRTTETVEEYRKLKKGAQDNIKDVGGFVGGQLREGRRKNGMVLCRSMLTLDMDYGEPGIWDEIDLLHDFRCCVYSTHKHTPEHPRLRIIIPLARDITENEYPAVARMVAKEIGIDLFDDTTYEACRLMYWPSTSANGEFFYKTKDGPLLDPDAYLAKYADWHDASTWPVSSRQSEAVRRSITQQADPLEKPGIVGAFCRAYTIEEAIETFLSDVYEPSSMNGRYDYIPADSAAGVVVYDGKFAYSHHATDPVCGKLLNAFDLVRLHKFRELDENVGLDTPPGKLPSFKAMSDLALGDDKVKAVFAGERIAQAAAEFSDEDWQNGLELDKSGHVKNTLRNLTSSWKTTPTSRAWCSTSSWTGWRLRGKYPGTTPPSSGGMPMTPSSSAM